MKKKDRTISQEIAAFVLRARFSNISPEVIERLKLHLLDALGCAFGALQGLPIRRLRDQIDEFGGKPICTLIGGGKSAPDRAACFNTALTRYLDFMDNFLAEGETCHPSDNIGSVLTAAEFADATGQDLLTALAVAYEVECRLTAGAPIMEKGFDHTTQLAHSIAAGTGKLLGLNEIQLGHALGLAGVELNALAVTRAAPTTQWKGFASSNVAFDAMHLVFQARSGMTGPLNVFEGVKGFEEALGKKVKVDWRKDDFSNVAKCILKRFNAEVHAQSALEGILELRRQHRFQHARIKEIEITIFHTAYDIVGGGQYGDRSKVSTREEADHSLPYMAAVAILDGDVQPQQYNPGRITRADVQGLMQKVKVHPPIRIEKPKALVEKIDPYSRKYPDQMPCKIEIKLMNGRAHEIEKTDYSGFYTRPWGWDDVTRKFRGLARRLKKTTQDEIIDMVRNLENTTAVDLMKLLGEASA